MKKAFIYILSATMMLAACVDNLQNENDLPDESSVLITETISARVNEGDTKATIDGSTGTFAWTQSVDKIAVHTTAGYVTSEGASASGATANFTVSYTGSRNAFAIYPSSIVAADAENYGQEGHTLDVRLPATYTLAEVSGETSPCPMIAANTPGTGWEFKQLCGLLRLTVNDIPASTKRLEIDFDGKKVSGSFSIGSLENPVTPGESVIATSTDAINDNITITNGGEDFSTSVVLNIPLPSGTYTNIFVLAYDALTEGSASLVGTLPLSKTIARGGGLMRVVSKHFFSVSSTEKVVFSPGNLVKTDGIYSVGSGNESYDFESTPFNTNGGSLGYGQGSPTSTSARGYFKWSEIISDGETSESPRLFTVNGVANWRVLTRDEWYYLLITREMNSGVSTFYRVRTGNADSKTFGLLLPPDNATSSDKEGITLYVGSVNNNVNVDVLVEKGWVFLPGAGGVLSSGIWDYAGLTCYYWSSTSFTGTQINFAKALMSSKSTDYYVDSSQGKTYYLATRLVRKF